ncbi:hypothetical protein [Mariniflexile sp. AS56]
MPGDSLYVQPSATSYGEIVITKPVTLIGFSHSDPIIRTVVEEILLRSGASNVNINGFKVNKTISTPPSNSTQITNLTILNCYILGQLYFAGSGVEDLLVQGNVLPTFGSSSQDYNNFSDAIIMNNVFFGHYYVKNHQSVTSANNLHTNGRTVYNMDTANGMLRIQNSMFIVHWNGSGSYSYNNSGMLYENCLSFNFYGSRGINNLSGNDNINNINPQFVNGDDIWSSTRNFHLNTSSPAIGAGKDGNDIGIFNAGPFTFNNNGYANGIPTVNITSLTPIVPTNGELEVNISTTSY